jgi:phenylacetate-CoA ligase
MKKVRYKPILKQLIGRTNDVAILPSSKSAGLTFYYITKSIIEGRRKCKRVYGKQTTIDTFIIKYVSDIVLVRPN